MHCFLQTASTSLQQHALQPPSPFQHPNETLERVRRLVPIITMFRARKPSVQRAAVGKHAANQLLPIKPEPRAVVDTKPKQSSPPSAPSPSTNQDEPQPTNVANVNTMPFRPSLSHMPFPDRSRRPANRDHPSDSLEDSMDTKPDLRYWEKKRHYAPCQGEDSEEEDLTRPVRKDRKFAPENDPLFAQMFAMFPDEEAAK